tara:strand:+ start:140 stop:724 length:585 start_codon:yes stop_codon:yes gene_type:complete
MNDKMIIGEDTKYPIEVSAYAFKGTVETTTEHNIRFAIEMVNLDERDLVPMMFVYTEDKMFVLPLSVKLAKDTKLSAAEQVIPLLKVFKNNEDKTGKIIGYQVIFEAWMGRAKITESDKFLKNYKYGDIAKMEQRIEAIVNIVNLNKKELKTEIYEIQQLESDKKVTVKKLDKEFDMPSTNPKFPNYKDLKVDY